LAARRATAGRAGNFGLSRRALLAKTAGAVAAAGAAPALLAAPSAAVAAGGAEQLSLERCVYLILRVQEATQQEERLITSGKFKDLQRANIKAAAAMMLSNYRLNDCVTEASKQVADKSKIIEATEAGYAAVDALNQINEYFDQSDNSLQVNSLPADKQKFILKALVTARTQLDAFLGYLPPPLVADAKKLVKDENDLNQKEYKAPDGSAEYLNPPPSGASK